MSEYLIVYGTSYGHTAKVVERVAATLRREGRQVTIWRGDALPPLVSLEPFEGVIIAGSVKFGRHQRYLRDFVRRFAPQLNAMPSIFISVCGALAGNQEGGRQEAREYVQRFLKETGWQPRHVTSVAGAVTYTRYGPITRWIMRRISSRTGRPTDTSRDWEFTDWEALESRIRHMIQPQPQPMQV